MENYIVSARKYRPASFKTVVGQQALAHTLKSAIISNRLAHAYLFCGPRGVGKTSCARIFAKAINCEHLTADGEACQECESCKAFNEQRSYNVIELDAASNNSVDEMRNLVDQVRIPPQIGKYKVYIIDEVHMLSTSAFNAFLKTLEEPPAHAIFILATTEKHKILPTILSRCQIYDFSRITIQDIVDQLKYVASNEGIQAEPAALNIIAQKADGAMRDALSIFDQVAASSMGNITYESAIENLNVLDYEYYFKLVDHFLQGNVQQSLLTFQEIRNKGFDPLFFINGLASHLRNLLVAASPATVSLLEVSNEVISKYTDQAKNTPLNFLYKGMDLCNDCDINYRTASNKQFLVELTLIKLCQILHTPSTPEPDNGLKKVNTTGNSTPVQNNIHSTVSAATTNNVHSVQSQEQNVHNNIISDSTVKYTSPQANIKYNSAPKTSTQHSAPKVISIRETLSINNNGEEAEKNNEPTIHRNEEFTIEQLKNVWNSYIETHKNEVFLINALSNTTPTISQDKVITIPVDNIAQQESIATHQNSLLPYFRNELKNDNITFKSVIKEKAQKVKVLTPEQIAVDLMKNNESVRNLITTLKLGLA